MPIIVEVDQSKRLLMTTLYGVVTDRDLVAHASGMRREPAYADFDELVQSRGDLRLRVTAEGVREVAAVMTAAPSRGIPRRLAIVIRTDKGRDLLRFYQTLPVGGDTVVRGFETNADAIAWLRPAAPGL
jgi:hypothetical protein